MARPATRFMTFWRRLGILLFALAGLVAISVAVEDPATGLGIAGAATTLYLLYLGLGWAINAFFEPRDQEARPQQPASEPPRAT